MPPVGGGACGPAAFSGFAVPATLGTGKGLVQFSYNRNGVGSWDGTYVSNVSNIGSWQANHKDPEDGGTRGGLARSKR